MCGIIGYVGMKNPVDTLVAGLERLEYRGYDSAGLAIISQLPPAVALPASLGASGLTSTLARRVSCIEIKKVAGRVENLKQHLARYPFKGVLKTAGGVAVGIGHTRWATHGQPSDENAHPHTDCSGKISLVHNGIIENFFEIKNRLSSHRFSSQTDSEVVAHLIEEYYNECGNLRTAVQHALKELHGTYALAVIHQNTGEIVAARHGSPLIIGVGTGEHFVASDVSAVVEHTRNVVYLEDLELGVIRQNGFEVYGKDGQRIQKELVPVDWDLEQSQKQGFNHFMLKEIHEQPAVAKETMRINLDTYFTEENPPVNFSSFKKLFVVACGSAGYASLIGKYVIEKLSRVPVEFDVASEFRYKDPILGPDDLVIAVSQSGETADTLAALRIAKEKGAKTLGIINVVNSTIAREADSVIYTRAGPEISVASTKAFMSQMIVFYKIAEKLSGKKIDLEKIPGMILRNILDRKDDIRAVAQKYYHVYNFIYIGRNVNYPVALEGALKLKEISYIHAEGYPSGEMKHGPIALVTDEVPTVAIVPLDSMYPKMMSNIQEIKARNGKVIAIATAGDEDIKKHCDDVLYVPVVDEILYPILAVVVAQLFAYYIADFRHCDIDKPRNLAKSVTVE
ncbi:MAG: glutamine--fructose-6-phosphate transaminase (isomerizing) [Candidatus Woesearchaeota archaeon]|nr:glutamine--fructose-6-phosphate transaminase (isomerizing) [Candidatus Woesearchaeota archaeon]